MPLISPNDWVAGFQTSRASGREGQVYLIEGNPRGEALKTAVGFLQVVGCTRSNSSLPCGTCRACVDLAERRNPDVQWIEPEGASRQILIDTVREKTRSILQKTSFGGKWKGLVFLHADRFTEPAANALLKAFEEPPPRTLLLLLTHDVEQVPSTVVSRCRRVRVPGAGLSLGTAEKGQVLARLAKLGPKAGPIERLAAATELSALLETFSADAETEAGDEETEANDSIRIARIRTRIRETTADFLRLIELWQRDLFLCLSGTPDDTLAFPEYARSLRKQAAGLRSVDAVHRIQAAETAARRLDLNLPSETVLDGFFQSLAR